MQIGGSLGEWVGLAVLGVVGYWMYRSASAGRADGAGSLLTLVVPGRESREKNVKLSPEIPFPAPP